MMAKGTGVVTPSNTAKRLMVWAGVVAGVLMIPLVANAPWTGRDFVFAGGVLFGAALGYELATQNIKNSKHQIIIGAGTVAMVLFVWALAVAD